MKQPFLSFAFGLCLPHFHCGLAAFWIWLGTQTCCPCSLEGSLTHGVLTSTAVSTYDIFPRWPTKTKPSSLMPSSCSTNTRSITWVCRIIPITSSCKHCSHGYVTQWVPTGLTFAGLKLPHERIAVLKDQVICLMGPILSDGGWGGSVTRRKITIPVVILGMLSKVPYSWGDTASSSLRTEKSIHEEKG